MTFFPQKPSDSCGQQEHPSGAGGWGGSCWENWPNDNNDNIGTIDDDTEDDGTTDDATLNKDTSDDVTLGDNTDDTVQEKSDLTNAVTSLGRSAQIYTVRQCVTSTFFFFFKASFSENYFMVLKIYDNPHTLVYGVTSQVCISSNNNTSNSGGVTH